MRTQLVSSAGLTLAALASPTLAQTVDGTITGDPYGPAVSVQTVNTEFGDNFSELNAAYAIVSGGRLYLALTGNIEDNFNKVEVFIDSVAGGENVLSGTPGNDNAANMTGLIFDAGFEADYHIIMRRGFFGTPRFDLDFAILGTPNFSQHFDVFGGTSEGSGTTGTGPGNASPIEVGYDNSNTAGVGGGNGPADQTAALAVTTGFELSIALSDLGNPAGDIRILAFVNNQDHNYSSNQYLGGLAAPQGNLGGDGTGGFTGGLTFDLGTFAGDQFFTVSASGGPFTSLCFGDGSGAPCGCGNEASTPSGCLNTAGVGATLTASGNPSVSADTMSLTADNVINQPGLFFQGNNAIGGGTGTTFGDGIRCCGQSVVRIQVVNPPGTASPATATMTETATTNGPAGTVTPGSTKCYQYWYRDPSGGGVCGSSFNLSNAVTVTWQA